MKTTAKQTGVYYGMYVYAIEADNGQRVELPPSVEPTIEGLAGLLDSDKEWGTDADRAIVETHLTALMREAKLKEIEAYDSSLAVNSFSLDGMDVWLDFELRSKLRSRLPVEEAAGRDTTTLWLGTHSFTLPVKLASALLARIELYAADCFDVTSAHKAAVEALDTREAIEAYDHTTGYPERLTVSTQQ
ncbi:DUF4376 domain-containing protein [uncultured Duncaniella sp.]|uniref:DUF4376 domain-containing protein n=1 Tax=uncultured Duncaniella sp. TaxID=2768039 RepID=UPI0025CE15F5|nr:DUF4376 domain-containing protein [uncultured Duncaniella sp.]